MGLKMCLYTHTLTDRSHALTKSFTGTLVYLKKIFIVLLPKYICCLGPTHTHTQSKVHYHTSLFVMDFPVLLQ